MSSLTKGALHRVVTYAFETPGDFVLWLCVVPVVKCVLDARVPMPVAGRPIQLGLAALLVVAGGWMFTAAGIELPKMGVLPCEASLPAKPLTTGQAFGLCRHPQYAGLISLCLGFCIFTRSADRLFWTLALMVLLDKKADLEEAALSRRHPEYASYMLAVPKFIPNVPSALTKPFMHAIARHTSRDSDGDGDGPEYTPLLQPSVPRPRLSDLPEASGSYAEVVLRSRAISTAR